MSFRGLIRYVLKMQETWRIIADLQGWKRSFKEGRPLDGEGRSIPWYTYPAIEFIRSLQLNESKVFEYGAGNSSVFWAGCTKKVIAVENDPAWADEIRLKNISNLTVLTMESREDYINAPTSIDEIFDIVIIDGRYRKDCANIATKIISEHGIIIFDNSDWYPDACAMLRAQGWFQIDFSGLGPINPYAWTTSVFMRTDCKVKYGGESKAVGGNYN